jgi:methionyl-tRNA formyltransferase
MGNNRLGWNILEWLCHTGENIVGLVVHPEQKRQYGEEMIRAVSLPADRIFDGSQIHEAETFDRIKSLEPDIVISVLFGYILQPEFLDIPPRGSINVHPALLPHNRGAYSNVWSIVDGTPAGVTIHYIDTGIDTGDIIAQREVAVTHADTGETLYRKLESESLSLFKDTWPRICSNFINPVKQSGSEGSYHRVSDVERIDEINLEGTYTAKELIDIIRARTFPPYKGAYIRNGRDKIYLRLQLLHEHELGIDDHGKNHQDK